MVKSGDVGTLLWHEVDSTVAKQGFLKLDWNIYRAKVPGGWLVLVMHNTSGLTFYPDPDHKWDGTSLV